MSNNFVKLFGEELVSSTGPVKTASALENKVVGIYFSAHWCPPCRMFTPVLAEAYSKNLAAKGLEVVFVSSDSDQESFDEYFASMPWKALPYAERATKDALSKKFKVRGIPTFVLLDTEGNVITTDGRSSIQRDPEGVDFPWTPKPFGELLGTQFLGKSGALVGKEAIEGKVLGLYFSAHWCPPCRGFTPQLAEWYKKISSSLPNFEIVFISSDQSEEEFQEYFHEMPWIALPHSERQRKEQLSERFEIRGIPSFVIVDSNGSTITTNGRGIPSRDPEGKEFPWYPSAVSDLASERDGLQDSPCLIALADGVDEGTRTLVKAAMEVVAKEEKAKEGEDDLGFFFGGPGANGILNVFRRLSQQPLLLQKHEHPLTETDRPNGWQCDGCSKSGKGKAFNCSPCDFDFCADCNAKAVDKLTAPVSGLLMDLSEERYHVVVDVDFTKADSIRAFIAKLRAKALEFTPIASQQQEDED